MSIFNNNDVSVCWREVVMIVLVLYNSDSDKMMMIIRGVRVIVSVMKGKKV